MNVSLTRLTDIVSLMLGEYPDWKSGGHDMLESVSLSEMCSLVVGEEARAVTMEFPIEKFSSPVDMRSEIYLHGDFTEEGMCEFELPSDFARLHALKMQDWSSSLNDSYRGDRLILSLGNAAPSWMAGRVRRPKVDIYNLGEKGSYMKFVCSGRSFPESAAYIPMPVYDSASETLRRVDPALLMILCRAIAERIAGRAGLN